MKHGPADLDGYERGVALQDEKYARDPESGPAPDHCPPLWVKDVDVECPKCGGEKRHYSTMCHACWLAEIPRETGDIIPLEESE